MIWVLKLKLKLFSLFRLYFWSYFYRIYFNLHPAFKVGKNFYCTGRLLLNIHPEAIIIIGDNCRIHSGYKENPFYGERPTLLNVNKCAKLILGNNIGISNSSIYCTHEINIEDYVMIGGGCQIYDSNFHPLDFESRVGLNGVQNTKSEKIIIKLGAFIGGGTHITKGSCISEKEIVPSMSRITKIK